jgi:predicted DNA-binding protein
MKKTITLANLVIEWSDGKTEELSKVLPEYLREELEVYFDELEDLREEHDADMRDEPYHFEEELK